MNQVELRAANIAVGDTILRYAGTEISDQRTTFAGRTVTAVEFKDGAKPEPDSADGGYRTRHEVYVTTDHGTIVYDCDQKLVVRR